MEEYFSAGDAGWTAQLNAVIQASSRAAYHVSGGQITPGTSATNVSVAVEGGDGVVGGTEISWAGEELILEDGGVGPSGTDQNEPRVDAIFARQDDTLGVATGEPEPFTPDTLPDGSAYTPAPMEHWTPAPDSGSRIGGLVLGFVLVGTDATTASDIPTENVQNWKIGTALESSRLVFGDGSPNGPTEISVNDDPITIDDEANTDSPFFDYDPTANTLTVGEGDTADFTLGSQLFTDNRRINFDSSNGLWEIIDNNPDAPGAIVFGTQTMGMGRNIGMNENDVTQAAGVRSEVFHFRTGEARIFCSDASGHLIYRDPTNNEVDLTPNL